MTTLIPKMHSDSRSFLVGRFLPAYGATFGRIPKKEMISKGLSTEKLALRFAERALSYQDRSMEYLIIGQIGVVLALSLTIGAFRMNVSAKDVLEYVTPDQEIVQMEDIQQTQQTQQIERPPPPPRPPIPVVVPDDALLEDEDLNLDMALDLEAVLYDLPPPPPAAVEEEIEEIFVVVEQMPTIIGGLQQLYKYVNYPTIAQKAGIEGTVVIQIVVSPEGLPTQPQIIKSAHDMLDQAALAGVVQLRFTPALQRGRAVPVYMSIPVKFDLK